jgi:hypothetical protein
MGASALEVGHRRTLEGEVAGGSEGIRPARVHGHSIGRAHERRLKTD